MLDSTHIHIDDKTHKIVEVQEMDGVRHTHRVHTSCGLTIDVDHGGVKHLAAAAEYRQLATNAKTHGDLPNHLEYLKHAQRHEAEAKRHQDEQRDANGRWRKHLHKAADCAHCAGHEAGTHERFVREQGFNTPVKPIPGRDQGA